MTLAERMAEAARIAAELRTVEVFVATEIAKREQDD